MKIASAYIYALNIPFVESFSHNLHERNSSDSIIVRLITDSGISGFGEGVPRSYVTGETQKTSVDYIRDKLLPGIIGTELDGIDTHDALAYINEILSAHNTDDTIVWNASRSAVELAFIDCLFRSKNLSVNTILPAEIQEVIYSGVITAGPEVKIENTAQRCKAAGFKYIKMKVSEYEDIKKVVLVRDIMGSSVSIRLDANCAFNKDAAVRFLSSVEKYNIECIEQPIPRGNMAELVALRSASTIPIMADESIVTILDAKKLIENKAVDYFNLRISKCGGIYNTLAIAALAKSAGLGIQLGCQVGETAVLSAAGRHVAANFKDLRFVEGSYGTHLLKEDIAEEDITLSHRGKASVLPGVGLGVSIQEALLDKYSQEIIHVI